MFNLANEAHFTLDLPGLEHDFRVLSFRAIEGGRFTMGDFGAVGDDGIWRPFFPPTLELNQPHEVTLSSYSLSRHKTTWEDFDTYLLANNLDVIEPVFEEKRRRIPFNDDESSRFYLKKPAEVTWREAEEYCRWLGLRTGLPRASRTSPPSAFAARNRGSSEWV